LPSVIPHPLPLTPTLFPYTTLFRSDGMNINSNYVDGTIQNYVDNAIIQQATYQTSGINAEVSAGGALVNQIPKDGGNNFHSDVLDRKSTRLNSSHQIISYAVFCLKK